MRQPIRSCSTFKKIHDSVWSMAWDNPGQGFLQTSTGNEGGKFIFSGGRDGSVYRTNLETQESELVCKEAFPILKVLPDKRTNTLWVSTTSPVVNNWTVDKDQVNRVNITVPGCVSVIKSSNLLNRREVLFSDAQNKVSLWDICSVRLKSDHFITNEQKSKEDIEEIAHRFKEKGAKESSVSIPSWFTIDLKTGIPHVNLHFPECFSGKVHLDEAGFSQESIEAYLKVKKESAPEEIEVNLGERVIFSLFLEWVKGWYNIQLNSPDPVLNQDQPIASEVPEELKDDQQHPLDQNKDEHGVGDTHTNKEFELPVFGRTFLPKYEHSDPMISSILNPYIPNVSFTDTRETFEEPRGEMKKEQNNIPKEKKIENQSPKTKKPELKQNIQTTLEEIEKRLQLPVYSIPPSTSVTVCETNGETGLCTILKKRVGEFDGKEELPHSLRDCLIKEKYSARSETQYAFYLRHDQNGKQYLPPLLKSRFQAARSLRVRAISKHLINKVFDSHITLPPSLFPYECFHMTCKGEPLPPNMDLGTIHQLIWKSSEDMVIEYTFNSAHAHLIRKKLH
eukprot:TRINITY_DN5898_c0_g1_i9.p1 TRINITY_DN5898_c0_g1~~TRINITY_DN5898_c0_g1_i9.p1  ORF type:complete len:564 (+),score=107.85 TRINITY_DN5898_c0_g1_i9:692-2383(+)